MNHEIDDAIGPDWGPWEVVPAWESGRPVGAWVVLRRYADEFDEQFDEDADGMTEVLRGADGKPHQFKSEREARATAKRANDGDAPGNPRR